MLRFLKTTKITQNWALRDLSICLEFRKARVIHAEIGLFVVQFWYNNKKQ